MKKSIKRFFKPPKKSFFLFGPRAVGKSTWIKDNYKDSIYIDLLLSNVLHLYLANPERLIKITQANKENKIIIIDEIQKAPKILSIIHFLIEQKKGLIFILTGSSARKLKKEGVNLLAGRAIKKSMHPFMASEMGDLFDMEKALKYGMLPLILEEKEIEDTLQSYIDLYILQEVKYEGFVRNIENFARFLNVIPFSHASIINFTNISRECGIKRSTVENFVEILKDLLLADFVPIFSKRVKRHLVSKNKFYFFDCGIFRALKTSGILDTENEKNGPALEGLVYQHLKAWCDYSKNRNKVYYWRTKAGLEVDFIIYGEDGLWAIEVKNKSKVSSKDVRGLLHFKRDYPKSKVLLIYMGNERIVEKGILCISCEEFLKNLFPNKPVF